jgi:hypothetical protein
MVRISEDRFRHANTIDASAGITGRPTHVFRARRSGRYLGMTEHEQDPPPAEEPNAPEDQRDVEDALSDASGDTTKVPDADEESEATS